MGTLLEAIGIVLETYFVFGFPNACPIGDSLRVCLVGWSDEAWPQISMKPEYDSSA